MKYFIIFLIIFASSCGIAGQKEKNQADAANSHEGHQASSAGSDYCDSVNKGIIATDTLKGSPQRSAMKTINGTHVHIEYSSPGVKDRIIWGGLVAYDQVWVAGAHQATNIRFYKDAEVNGKTIPAGTYGLFMIPGKDSWQVIINSRYQQHLADDYNPAEDIVRVTVNPQDHALTPRLTYEVDKGPLDKDGIIRFLWEKVAIQVPFKVL